MRGLGARARHDVDLVTNPSVEARASPVCWSEIRRLRSYPVLLQQGTYALDDGVYPWMDSVAQDKRATSLSASPSPTASRSSPPPLHRPHQGRRAEPPPRPPSPQARPEHARSDSDRLPLQGVGWLGAVGADQDGPASGMTTSGVRLLGLVVCLAVAGNVGSVRGRGPA